MDIITIERLLELCKKEIAKGNGKKKIVISNDDEGNGYHALGYEFTDMTLEFAELCNYPVGKENYKKYIILG